MSGDKKKNKVYTDRPPWRCTSCGELLPKNKKEWGLIWKSEQDGMCVSCLTQIRENINYKGGKK